MSLNRIDNWIEKEDELLAETILNYIRKGKTQLQAFADVGEKIDRSAEACGFRWNKYVRGNYKEAVRMAKRFRRQQKADMPKFEKPEVPAKKIIEKVSVESLSIKEFEGHRVVTFKDIDDLHGRPNGTSSRNFTTHKNRFIRGEDYFHISFEESRSTNFVERPNSQGLIVLTESGYLMLVKSFTDDLAWEVQKKLVKTYFRVKEVASTQLHSYMIVDPIERAKAWIKEQEEKKHLETSKLLLEQQVADLVPKMTYLDTILESKDSIIVSQISADYGLSAKALNKILHEEEVQYKRNDQWLLYSEHTGQGYTESRTIPFIKPNGDQGSSIQTRWTQKGRLFIHNILSNKGIKPLMDR
jgi:RsfA family transcription factor